MAAVTRDAYDVRIMRPRLTLSDAIVIIGALASFLIGWAIKDWHDDRTRSVNVAGVSIAYPRNWVQWLTVEPEVFRVISTEDARIVAFLTTVQTPQTDVLQAVVTNSVNPARNEPGYTQLGNKTADVDGNAAVRTDYAYVESSSGGTSVPSVIRGRQYSWIKGSQLFTFALEGPEDQWDELQSQLNRLIGKLDTGA